MRLSVWAAAGTGSAWDTCPAGQGAARRGWGWLPPPGRGLPASPGPGRSRGGHRCPPFHADVDVAPVHGVQEALDERGPLQGKGGQEEGEAHAAEAIALQEGHEEAEAHEDHDVHILETCRGHSGLLRPPPIPSATLPRGAGNSHQPGPPGGWSRASETPQLWQGLPAWVTRAEPAGSEQRDPDPPCCPRVGAKPSALFSGLSLGLLHLPSAKSCPSSLLLRSLPLQAPNRLPLRAWSNSPFLLESPPPRLTSIRLQNPCLSILRILNFLKIICEIALFIYFFGNSSNCEQRFPRGRERNGGVGARCCWHTGLSASPGFVRYGGLGRRVLLFRAFLSII